jgi:hypothetical protein
MIRCQPVEAMAAEDGDYPSLDFRPVSLVDGVLRNALGRDIRYVGAHPLRDSRGPAGLARPVGVALGFQLLDLLGYLGLSRALTVPPVGPAVRLGANRHPAMPPAAGVLVDRGPPVRLAAFPGRGGRHQFTILCPLPLKPCRGQPRTP